MPASSLFQQPLEILARRSHQRFTIDPLEFTQAEPTHAMPVLALCKEWFHPDTALAHGFLVGLGRLIGTHPIQIRLIHTAAQTASLLIGGTLRSQWARVPLLDLRPVAALSVRGLPLHTVPCFTCWTNVDIPLRLRPEAVWAKKLGAVVVIGQGNGGVDVLPAE